MPGSPPRKPLITRLVASCCVWLIIVFLAVAFGFILSSRSDRRSELLGAQLPNVGLASAKGKISVISFSGGERRGTFGTPVFEFEAGGRSYQNRTLRSYWCGDLPFSSGQSVDIVFVESSPEKAWLKWEYDDLRAESSSLWVRAYDAIGPVYNYFAAAIVLLSGLILAINLFVPVFGLAKR